MSDTNNRLNTTNTAIDAVHVMQLTRQPTLKIDKNMQHVPTKIRSVGSAMNGIKHWLDIKVGRQAFLQATVAATGLTFKVPSNTIFSWYLSKYGTYEANNTNFLIDLFADSQDGIFVDVGANFGWYTCLLSKFAGANGQVIAIEPEADNLALLTSNIFSNQLRNVQVLPIAVSFENGTLPIHKAPAGNPGMHSFVTMPHTPNEHNDSHVTVRTLDGVLKDITGPIKLMKVDIEGFEVNALRGAQETLARCNNLLIEYSPGFLLAGGQQPVDFFNCISNAGLDINTIESGKLCPLNGDSIASLIAVQGRHYCWQQDFFCTRSGQ